MNIEDYCFDQGPVTTFDSVDSSECAKVDLTDHSHFTSFVETEEYISDTEFEHFDGTEEEFQGNTCSF